MIKFNEAISIKKTYEIILKRLKEERLAYDKQLEAMEKAIKAKNADFDELLMLSHDANHARSLAEVDLNNYESQINTIRQNRMKDIQE
jgi:Skp family chaperone for outer membrane proteins